MMNEFCPAHFAVIDCMVFCSVVFKEVQNSYTVDLMGMDMPNATILEMYVLFICLISFHNKSWSPPPDPKLMSVKKSYGPVLSRQSALGEN